MLRNLCFLLFFSIFMNTSHAQLEKVLHQTFFLEEIDLVALNVAGDIEIEQWAGNTIMTETRVKLYEGSPGIINYFVKAGRYDIEKEDFGTTGIKLNSKDNIRRPIRTKTGECYEEVTVRVFVPEDFEKNQNGTLERVKEEVSKVKNVSKPDSIAIKSVAIDSLSTDSILIKQDTLNQ